MTRLLGLQAVPMTASVTRRRKDCFIRVQRLKYVGFWFWVAVTGGTGTLLKEEILTATKKRKNDTCNFHPDIRESEGSGSENEEYFAEIQAEDSFILM